MGRKHRFERKPNLYASDTPRPATGSGKPLPINAQTVKNLPEPKLGKTVTEAQMLEMQNSSSIPDVYRPLPANATPEQVRDRVRQRKEIRKKMIDQRISIIAHAHHVKRNIDLHFTPDVLAPDTYPYIAQLYTANVVNMGRMFQLTNKKQRESGKPAMFWVDFYAVLNVLIQKKYVKPHARKPPGELTVEEFGVFYRAFRAGGTVNDCWKATFLREVMESQVKPVSPVVDEQGIVTPGVPLEPIRMSTDGKLLQLSSGNRDVPVQIHYKEACSITFAKKIFKEMTSRWNVQKTKTGRRRTIEEQLTSTLLDLAQRRIVDGQPGIVIFFKDIPPEAYRIAWNTPGFDAHLGREILLKSGQSHLVNLIDEQMARSEQSRKDLSEILAKMAKPSPMPDLISSGKLDAMLTETAAMDAESISPVPENPLSKKAMARIQLDPVDFPTEIRDTVIEHQKTTEQVAKSIVDQMLGFPEANQTVEGMKKEQEMNRLRVQFREELVTSEEDPEGIDFEDEDEELLEQLLLESQSIADRGMPHEEDSEDSEESEELDDEVFIDEENFPKQNQ